ncbi:MAG TPA: putative O-glycosylation ligase, exosortase A system-associated [Thiobacillaceae bacterium]|nr:putative O-glycosylation ligase, exosortase A system-associated [Thiobacillaceae bacterium]
MQDISSLIMLLAMAGMTWREPWMGLLGLGVLNIVHPQGVGDGQGGIPAYSILLGITLVSAFYAWSRKRLELELFWDWRFAVLLMLLGQFAITTWSGMNPWAAWPKLADVGKMFVPLMLMIVLIDNSEKLRLLLIVIAGSVALVAVKGGFWAFITGFQDRVYGAPGSEMAGNNEFAIAVAMTIPLLLLWRDEISDRALRAVLAVAIVLCFGSALSSWSRGAFLSLGAMSLLLIWHYRRKTAPLIILVTGLVAIGLLFPEGWLERMTGMGHYQADESAMGRLEVWQSGWNYLLAHPWLGGGFESWIYVSLPNGSRDWHSAYIKMGAEHGFPGLLLWGALLAGTILSLTRMGRLGKRWRLDWVQRWAAMLRASLMAYAVGAIFLGIAYWELFYWLLVASVLATRFAIQEQRWLLRAQCDKGKGFGHGRRRELARADQTG